jgi:hypothetical protein
MPPIAPGWSAKRPQGTYDRTFRGGHSSLESGQATLRGCVATQVARRRHTNLSDIGNLGYG